MQIISHKLAKMKYLVVNLIDRSNMEQELLLIGRIYGDSKIDIDLQMVKSSIL